jgi:hypothetical protein
VRKLAQVGDPPRFIRAEPDFTASNQCNENQGKRWTFPGAAPASGSEIKPLRKREKFGFVLQKKAQYNLYFYLFCRKRRGSCGARAPLDSDLPKIDMKCLTTLS